MGDEDKPTIKQEPVIVIISEEERENDSFDDSGSEEEEEEEEDEEWAAAQAARAAFVAAHSSPYVKQHFEKGNRTIGVHFGGKGNNPFQVKKSLKRITIYPNPSTYATAPEACRAHDLMLLADPRIGFTAQEARDRGLNYDLGWTDPEVKKLLEGTRAETAFSTCGKPWPAKIYVNDIPAKPPRRSGRVEKENNAGGGGAGAGGNGDQEILTLSSSEEQSASESEEEEEGEEEEDEGAAARAAFVAAHSSQHVQQYVAKGRRTIGLCRLEKSAEFRVERRPDLAKQGGKQRVYRPTPSSYETQSEACRAHDVMLLTDPRFGFTAQEARNRGLNHDLGWTDPEVARLLKGTKAETAFSKQGSNRSKRSTPNTKKAPPPKKAKLTDKGTGGGGAGAGAGAGGGRGKKERPPQLALSQPQPRITPGTPAFRTPQAPPSSSAAPVPPQLPQVQAPPAPDPQPAVRPPPAALSEDRLSDPSALADWLSELTRWIWSATLDQPQNPILLTLTRAKVRVRRLTVNPGARGEDGYLARVRAFAREVGNLCGARGGDWKASDVTSLLGLMEVEAGILDE